MCSCWGIPCSLTAGPPTHNWLGSRSISASRPSLMLLSPALPLSHPSLFLSILLPPSVYLFSAACSSLSPSLPPSVPSPFSASVSSLSEDWLQAHCQAALAKINNIILIQTDIKRHRASKPFLCRLIISPCFSASFIFCRLVPSISSLEGSSGLHSPSMSEQSLDVTFDADKFGRVAVSIHEL